MINIIEFRSELHERIRILRQKNHRIFFSWSLDWCEEGQFVCGNSRFCVDQDKVCNGYSDCPSGEDEKKCAALIEDDSLFDHEEPSYVANNENNSETTATKGAAHQSYQDHFEQVESTANKDILYDQEAVESTISESTTLHALKGDVRFEKIISARDETFQGNREHPSATTLVSGREISSNAKDTLAHGNSIHVDAKRNGTTSTANLGKEINNYNEKGYLTIRKNGKWGKLCLSGMDDLLQERQAAWTIEDLGRAVCKAITYQ